MTRLNPSKRDQNNVSSRSGIASSGALIPVMLRVDPVTNYLLVSNGSSSNNATTLTHNKRDKNNVPSVYGVSSVDGTTLVPIRCDSRGRLLVTYT